MTTKQVLSWVHFGDLHMTRAGEQNHQDFARLVESANPGLKGAVDFAILPGDNADDGVPAQFQLVASIASRLEIPLHILPGEHDSKSRSLRAFYEYLAADELPYAAIVKGHRCLFLDVVSGGRESPISGSVPTKLRGSSANWLRQTLPAKTA